MKGLLGPIENSPFAIRGRSAGKNAIVNGDLSNMKFTLAWEGMADHILRIAFETQPYPRSSISSTPVPTSLRKSSNLEGLRM